MVNTYRIKSIHLKQKPIKSKTKYIVHFSKQKNKLRSQKNAKKQMMNATFSETFTEQKYQLTTKY